MSMLTIQDLLPLINVASALITAVWAVSKIKGTTEKLGLSIDHLSNAVGELKSFQHELAKDFGVSKERIAAEFAAVRERLAIIENRLNN